MPPARLGRPDGLRCAAARSSLGIFRRPGPVSRDRRPAPAGVGAEPAHRQRTDSSRSGFCANSAFWAPSASSRTVPEASSRRTGSGRKNGAAASPRGPCPRSPHGHTAPSTFPGSGWRSIRSTSPRSAWPSRSATTSNNASPGTAATDRPAPPSRTLGTTASSGPIPADKQPPPQTLDQQLRLPHTTGPYPALNTQPAVRREPGSASGRTEGGHPAHSADARYTATPEPSSSRGVRYQRVMDHLRGSRKIGGTGCSGGLRSGGARSPAADPWPGRVPSTPPASDSRRAH